MNDESNILEHNKNKRRTRILGFILVTLLCIVAAELASRAFWSRYGVPFSDPGRILYVYYPEIIKVEQDCPSRGDGFYNILILGGSVLHKDWGSVENELRKQLVSTGRKNVRIYNLAMPGHTSRDSWLKYSILGNSRFDLVIFYHGINDARANNAPPEIFSPDYSHYRWYEMINSMSRYHGTALFALPYTLRFIAVSTRQILNKDHYIPFDTLREEWVQYGGSIRSAESFRQNLSSILDLASSRGDRVMLMSFATRVPNDYLPESYTFPLERWGSRENVLAAVYAHNKIIRELVVQHKSVLFADQEVLMHEEARYFEDPCHLSEGGSIKFVENILKVLLHSNI